MTFPEPPAGARRRPPASSGRRRTKATQDELPLDLPLKPPPPQITGNEVAVFAYRPGKAHRPRDERRPRGREWRDGDARWVGCGWNLRMVKHVLIAQVPVEDRCRVCWPGPR